MKFIYTYNTPSISNLLKKKKFKVENSLTEALLKSLATKIFYSLARCKLFDKLDGTIQLGEIACITPYRSVAGDVRYIIKITPFNEPITVFWDGKMSIAAKENTSGVFIDTPNINFTEKLNDYVNYEQQVIEQLNAIEKEFFEAVLVNTDRDENSEAKTFTAEEWEAIKSLNKPESVED